MTEILATVCGGPTWSQDVMRKAMQLGVTSFRITPGFRTDQQNVEIVEALRAAADAVGRQISLYYDVSRGSKLRTVNPEPVVLPHGETITVGDGDGCDIQAERPIEVNLPVGSILHLGDSDATLVVTASDAGTYRCTVVGAGKLGRGKAITAQGFDLGLGAVNEQNRRDIKLATELGIDHVILSFARDPADIRTARAMLGSSTRIVTKIETRQAVERIDEIVLESDVVMVARGDLALQCGFEQVALLQWRITESALRLRRPFIVATQMFESVISRHVPSRSDIMDLSYAVASGAHAVMFGPETCMNPECVRALETALSVITAVESESVKVGVRHVAPQH